VVIFVKILEELKIIPNDMNLFETAFTHTSYCNENKNTESYERLEFLGDKVLDFIVSEYLYKNRHLFEGEMTKIRASHVCEDALAEYSLNSHFDEYLKLGKGEENTGGRCKKAILADSFEAFIGALYFYQGIEKAKEFVNNTVIKSINENGMYFNYVLNLSCASNMEFTETGRKEIIDEIQPLVDMGVNHFTIALPSLIQLFETYFPQVKITLSIICGVDSLSKMECYCKFGNIDNIYIHEKVYRQPHLMRQMVNIAHKYNKKVGIIVNSFCLSECPFRSYHYNFGAHATYGSNYIIPEYYGSLCALMKIRDKRNVLNAPWVRPEDMKF